MTSREEHSLLANNLRQTYLAIGTHVPYTKRISGKGWAGVANPFAHPICNFAICEDSGDVDIEELKEIASKQQFYNIYVSHYSDEDNFASAANEAGLTKLYTLAHMCNSGSRNQEAASIRECLCLEERNGIADFMCRQFFSSQSPAVREKISAATISASGLRLYELNTADVRNRPKAAVMLHRTEGVIGLYNLCVAVPFRNKGLGSSIVLAAELLALEESVILGLQCDPSLFSWYEQLGLEHIGTLDVYGVKKPLSYNEG